MCAGSLVVVGGVGWGGAPREGKGRAPEVVEVSLESHLIVESQCVLSLVTVVIDCVIFLLGHADLCSYWQVSSRWGPCSLNCTDPVTGKTGVSLRPSPVCMQIQQSLVAGSAAVQVRVCECVADLWDWEVRESQTRIRSQPVTLCLLQLTCNDARIDP